MLSEILLAVFVLLLVYVLLPKKPAGLPPGLWGWPIIGSVPSSGLGLGDQVVELRKKYGDIISWRVGSRIFVFLCNFKHVKTVFSKTESANRPELYSLRSLTGFTNTAIGVTNGDVWHFNRRFALRHLKDLGMGKSYLGSSIEEEARYLVEDFEKYVGPPVQLPWSLTAAVQNVIWQLIAGRRYDINDKKVTELNKQILLAFEAMSGPVLLLDFFPVLISILPFWLRTKLGMNNIYMYAKKVHDFLMEETLDDHKKNMDRENPRDFIDAYLVEMEKQKGDPNSTMSIEDLSHGLVEFFTAGSLTTSLTLRWAILCLTKYPEVQAKVQRQIDAVVPKDVQPSLEYRSRLPYLEAVIHEVERYSSLGSTGVPHYASEDIHLEGYIIPKNAIIIGHNECCHSDPAFWENPDEFYPEHFLDENGKFRLHKEGFLPFSVGRRVCIGEALAQVEMYLFLSALLQKFTFSVPEGEEISLTKSTEQRLINIPKPINIVITKRN